MAEDPTWAALREVSISLDVTQVDRSENAFARMREIATNLAQAMEGSVTDDNAMAVADSDMAVIATEIERIYDTLAQRGIAAGSVLARRLFS